MQWSDIVFTSVGHLIGHLIYVKNKMKNRYILDTGLKCVYKTWGFALEHLKSSPEWKWEPSKQFLAQVVNFFKGLWMTPPPNPQSVI